MSLHLRFRPKLFDCLYTYSTSTFATDLSAGITVGIIALPMAMAFAIASNVPPSAGIITAVVAGFISSMLGGSRVSVSGPTGAFVAIVAGIGATYGFSGLLVCTMMAGLMLFIMGFARMGGLIRFIPTPLITGFTTGIAVIIFCGQLKDFMGIETNLGNAANVIMQLRNLAPHLVDINPAAFWLGLVSLVGLFAWPHKWGRYVPASIAVMIVITAAATVAAHFFQWDIATIGSRFGSIPRSIDAPTFPFIDFEVFQRLLAPSATIALLGAIESLLCATAADSMIDDNHDPDQELMAQGIANFVVPFFGGIPSTGAIARTAANIRSGGKTPVAGMIHAVVLLAIMLLAAPLASYVPLVVLSAILIKVAINMADWKEFLMLARYPKSDSIVFLLTFLLTIVFGLTQAVSVGMLLACLLFIRRMSAQSKVGIMHLHPNHHEEFHEGWKKQGESEGYVCDLPSQNEDEACDDITIVTVSGAMFFGASQKLKNILLHLQQPPKVLILKMHQVITMDATAALALEEIIIKCWKKRVPVFIVGLRDQARHTVLRAGLLEHISRHNLIHDMDKAIAIANKIIAGEISYEEASPPATLPAWKYNAFKPKSSKKKSNEIKQQ